MTELTLGQKIMILRKNKNLSQKELAKKINVGIATLARYETNTRPPNLDALKALSFFFNVSIDYLVKDTNSTHDFNDEDLFNQFKCIDLMPDTEKKVIKGMIKGYIDQQKTQYKGDFPEKDYSIA